MSEASQIPSEFEYSASFLRIFIPGIILVTLVFLLSLTITYIFIKNLINESVWSAFPIGIIFIIVSVIAGIIINAFINFFSLMLEGFYLEKYQKQYLFNWDEIPGDDSDLLKEYLIENFDVEWVRIAKIKKSSDGKTINLSDRKNSLSLTLYNEKMKVNLTSNFGVTNEFIVKTENGELNIYDDGKLNIYQKHILSALRNISHRRYLYDLCNYGLIHFMSALRDVFYRGQWKKFYGCIKDWRASSARHGSVKGSFAYNNVYDYFSHCLYELEKTKNRRIRDDGLKKCILPTRLGNVFRSMEIYPEWKYGMNGLFFWARIQLLMSEENKKTMDKKRAFVDMSIELTWIFIFAAIGYSIFFFMYKNYVFSVISFGLFFILSYFFYERTVGYALEFGRYFRSIFDLYREELWDKIKNNQFNKLDSLPEKERWNNVFRYLWFYRIARCQKCGEFYESTGEHNCKKF